jgi:hypothetical protein
MLDFRIKTFIAVCKYMNYTKASEKLNLTQPCVSQHIHYLEDYYGVKLFTPPPPPPLRQQKATAYKGREIRYTMRCFLFTMMNFV